MKPSIMFVDDEASILRAVRRIFREAPYEVRTAESAQSALAMLADTPADVVVSDFRMPGIDGVTFLHSVYEKYPDTVRILLTGFADVAVAQEAINEARVFRFLTKPWVDTDLQNIVQLAVFELDRRRKEQFEAEAEKEVNLILKAKLENLSNHVRRQEGAAAEQGRQQRSQLASTSRGLLAALLAKQPQLNARLQQNAFAASRLVARSGETWLLDYVVAAGWLHEIGALVQAPLAPNHRADDRYQQDHCQIAARILQAANYPSLVVEAVLYHHENWNGTGPWGIRGLQIPLLARALRAVDYLTAYTTAYRQGETLPNEALVSMIDAGIGREIDPRLGAMLIGEIQTKGARSLFPAATAQLPEFESLNLTQAMEPVYAQPHLGR